MDQPRPFAVSLDGASSHEITLRVMSFDPLAPWALDFSRFEVECPDMLATASANRRREFLAGRRCAASALAALGSRGDQVRIGPDGAPAWPAGFRGSISHCTRWAAAAVSAKADVWPGVDCESVIDEACLDEIANLVASRDELDAVERHLKDRRIALTVVFSAKESAFKSLPPQLRADCTFSSFKVQLVGRGSTHLLVRDLRRTGQMASIEGAFIHLDEAHVLTLVSSFHHTRRNF